MPYTQEALFLVESFSFMFSHNSIVIFPQNFHPYQWLSYTWELVAEISR